MTNENSGGWGDYRPSKTMWFWSSVACVVATMVIGFAWGGWVTGGSADQMAEEARETGRAELASAICVQRFVASPDAAVQLAALKDESSWQRGNTIADAGWTTPFGLEEPVSGAADLCADALVAMEMPATQAAAE